MKAMCEVSMGNGKKSKKEIEMERRRKVRNGATMLVRLLIDLIDMNDPRNNGQVFREGGGLSG